MISATKPPMTEEKKKEIAAFKSARRAEQSSLEKKKASENAVLAESYAVHSLEELDAICAQGQADMDAAKERLRVVRQVRDAKWAEQEAKAKVARMSPAEKNALAQALGLAAVESKEAVVGLAAVKK